MTDNASTLPALNGVRVLDTTSSVAGQYCGRLLADFGAEVFLVEPPGGTQTRFRPPFTTNRQSPENSLLFWNLNSGKSSIVLDPIAENAEKLREMAKTIDIILVDADKRSLFGNGKTIGDPVICSVSAFGTTGPYSHWQGCEMVYQALSGVMYPTGRGDREPLYGVGQRASYAAGVTAYITVLAALWNRTQTGDGQDVETNVAEAAAAMAQNLVTQYGYSQNITTRVRYPGALAEIKCKDGWLVFFALHSFRHIAKTFGVADWESDPKFENFATIRPYWLEFTDQLSESAKDRSVEELVEALQISKISSARMHTVPDLLASEHFRSRGDWQTVGEGSEQQPALGPVIRMQSPSRPTKPAPRLNAHNANRLTATSPAKAKPTAAKRDALPLKGIKVMDFTLAWAGPFATRALSFLGADVIRIENAGKLDTWRGPADGRFDPAVYFRRSPGTEPYNRHSWFNTQNHDKRSISLDLKSPKGRELALKLAAQCDVAIANFAPGSLRRMGLGYDELKKANENIILVEMPAYGNTGPMAKHAGMGKTMEASAGMGTLIGYGDGAPVLTGPAHLDPIGGLHGAAAVLTALNERARTGKGQYVEAAQVEAAMHWIGEYILQTAMDGKVFEPQGNAVPDAAPHDAFPCDGTDEWVVIGVFNDTQWAALRKVTGIKAFDDAAYATHEGRVAGRTRIGQALSAWTKKINKHDCAIRLQSAGIPAAPVNTAGDVFADPHLRSRGFIYAMEHPSVGMQEYSSLAYRLHGTPGSIRTPAPRFGADTDAVLGELGLSTDEIEAFIKEGVVHRTPILARKS